MSLISGEDSHQRLLRPLLLSVLAAVALYAGSVILGDVEAVGESLARLGVTGWTIVLGLSLVLLGRWRVWVGLVVAAFFVAIFPGNISQLVTRTPAFGLETDAARAIRLVFQPLLVIWALWATGAWSAWRNRRARR